MITNQASSLSIGLNDMNTSKTSDEKNTSAVTAKTSGGKNAIAMESNIRNNKTRKSKRGVNSTIKNEGLEELNGDAKVGLKVQPKRDAKVGF